MSITHKKRLMFVAISTADLSSLIAQIQETGSDISVLVITSSPVPPEITSGQLKGLTEFKLPAVKTLPLIEMEVAAQPRPAAPRKIEATRARSRHTPSIRPLQF